MATTYPTTTGDALLSPRPSPSPVPSPTTNTAIASSRPTLPRRSSSLHKMVITKLRPLPFQYRWAVWHSKPDAQQQYLLTPLVDDVPDIGTFYRIFNNMPWVQIKQNDSIHIFRSGVKPLWEDAENQRGGRWLIRVRPDNGRAIRVWEEICLLCCGGELQAAIAQERDHILGMSFSPRLYFTHISIWTKQGNNLRSILLLERAIVEGLSADLRPRSDTELNYRKHVDKIGLSVQGQENRIPQMPPMTTSRPVLLRAMTAG